ncbi:geminin-like [Hydractinia symbiolongicarpus]|uniref:geminin-like n=1 Tax=Hydractinia symbiolongicarpus TaxID=13093 RepID=UPI002550CF42|nr:geminin-like [Hydractinia symbiolongicarpus]XP_057289773.1 geminin-like [Hydractinia symbiolongicarpus]
MANEVRMATSLKDLTNEVDKENNTPDVKMKNVLKLGGKSLQSPFSTPGSGKHKPFKILTDDEIAIINSKKSGSGSGKKPKTAKRRSLATLQQSAQGKGTLVGQNRDTFSIKEAFSRKGFKKLEEPLHKNRVSESSSEGTDVEKDLVEDAITLMKATETVNDSYWKTIAEERRLALEETLNENDKLYDEIDALKEENEKLKKELNEAEYFKILYNNLLEASSPPSEKE